MIRYKNLSLSPSPKYLRVRHCGVSARDDIPNRQEEASRIPKTIPLFAGILKIRSGETYLEQFEKQFPDLSPRYQPRSRASTFAGSKPVIEGVQAAKCGKGQRGRRRSFTRWNDSTDNFVIRTLGGALVACPCFSKIEGVKPTHEIGSPACPSFL